MFVYLFFSFSSHPPATRCVLSAIIYCIENEEDNASHSPDREGNAFLDECSKKDVGKRRASLAAKMTSNLRRLSGAAELKIDINDPVSSHNPKYCNKKIKVSVCVCANTRPTGQLAQKSGQKFRSFYSSL